MLPLLPCFKVLPLVYDESLSYYEVLCKLTNLIKEMAKNVDGNFNSIQNEIEKIYNKITDLKAYVDEQDRQLSNRIDLTNERITEEIRKCKEHCEIYAKRLYDQLLDILNQYQGEMKQWVLGEIAKIPTGIPKQFAITGNPETSGLQHDIITVTRESMCDFVNSDKYTCEQVDDIGIPIIFYEDSPNSNANSCYDYDTKCFYELSHLILTNFQTDAPKYFAIQMINLSKESNQNATIVGTFGTITISLNVDKFIFKFEYNFDGIENETLEIPKSNFYIMFDIERGILSLLDIYKEQYRKLNAFTYNLPHDGNIGEIRAIETEESTYEIEQQIILPISTL